MADIRINALTEASASVTTDFLPIDGSTGTRKLSAFNPTFGGNATVTGTLTSTGLFTASATTSLDALPVAGLFGGTKRVYLGFDTSNDRGFIQAVDTGVAGKELRLQPLGSPTVAGGTLTVVNTTASTSTSTGALVVSGGVGIAKALFTGESSYLAGAVGAFDAALKNGFGRSANGYAYLDLVGDTTYTDYGLRIIRGNTGANAVSDLVHRGTGDFRISTSEAASLILRTGGTAALTITSNQTATFSGRLTVGTTALSDRMFYVSGSTGTTGASQFSAVVNPTLPNTVTTGAYGLYLGTNIASGATVTNSYSLFIASPDYTGSTVTNKYGLYSNDPNPSYFVGRVLIDSSTASTSTSSGALVVSGGVGVAKNSWFGEELVTVGTFWNSASSNNGLNGFNNATTIASNVISVYGSTGSNNIQLAGRVTTFDGGSGFYGLNLQAPTSAYPDFSGTVNFTNALTLTSQLATFATAIKTAAPSGGTAANWKLGTVATVSPTSPNRTIEVDIGGTIYYLAAKTTNN